MKISQRKAFEPGEEDHERVDVGQILKANQAMKANEDEFKVVFHPRRKRRDYIVLMTAGNLALLIPVILSMPNVFILASCLVGMVLFSAAISWIMWGVLGNY